jgi:hypothetical protein
VKWWIVVVSAALALLAVARCALLVPGIVETQATETRWALLVEARATRVAALQSVHTEGGRILDEVGKWRKAGDRQAKDLRVEVLSRVDALVDLVGAQTERANDSLAKVAGLSEDLKGPIENVGKLAEGAAGITSQVNAVLPDFLDCDGANRNCLFNRWVGMSWQAEKTMREVGDSAPEIAKAVKDGTKAGASIAQSGARIASSWEKQTPLYVRAIGWAGGVVLRLKTLVGWLF